jgi:hypothetical protein
MGQLNLYQLPRYERVAEIIMTGHPNSRKMAYLELSVSCGSFLSEKEIHTTIRRIAVCEGWIQDVLSKLLKGISSWAAQAIAALGRMKPKELLRQYEKDRGRIGQKVREVESTMDTPKMGEQEAREITRRLRGSVPQPPEKVISKYVSNNESIRNANDQVLSFTEFTQKWTVLYIVYGIIRNLVGIGGLLTGGAGLAGFALIHLPFLVTLADDLAYQIGRSEYVAP